jgi:hypothetical protein
MLEIRQASLYILQHDPLFLAGLFLIGLSGLIFFRIHKKLDKAGQASYQRSFLPIGLWFEITRKYVSCAGPNGWSLLPAYVVWICIALGVSLLVLGLIRL